jgi:hypothetical protein
MVNDCLSAAIFAGPFLPLRPNLPAGKIRSFQLSH